MTPEAKRYMWHRGVIALAVMAFGIPAALIGPGVAVTVVMGLSMLIADLMTEHENPWKDDE